MPEPMYQFIHVNEKGDVIQSPTSFDYLQDGTKLAKGSYGGNIGRTFEDYDGNISVKSDFNRSDYEWFRTNTSNLSAPELMKVSQKAYEKVSMVRHIIDMMADFTCQGIRIEHPNKKKERFLQEWFKYVCGPSISERFAHMLYRLGNVPIQTAFGVINLPNEEKLSVSKGEFDTVEYQSPKVNRRELPLKYTFVPPWEVEAIGGDLSLFIGQPYYAIKIPTQLKSELSKVNKIGDEKLRAAVEKTLTKIKPFMDKTNNYIYLDPKNFEVYFYKKDDWQTWAIPMIGAVLDDLIMLERMKLADMAALDGAISNIRHWTVGIINPDNPSTSIIPTKAGINRVKAILHNSIGGGTMDLVTGPEIQFKESNTQVHKFLGSEKYKVTLDSIYDGLGIPPPLRSGQSSGNTTNNYISLKVLIEKLNYGRAVLLKFWNKQLEIVQKALGHRFPGKVVFDNTVLADEAAEKQLLIQLIDRDIISAESVRKYFGYIPSLENIRVNREHQLRENGKMPPKASQFHTPQAEHEYKKLALQTGDVTPSELKVKLGDRKPGEKSRREVQEEQAKEKMAIDKQKAKQKPAGKTINGRPRGVTETRKRKPKPTSKPRTGKAYNNLTLWSTNAFNYISDKLSSIILDTFNKKNFRQLTTAEAKEAEDFKFNVFSKLPPMAELSEATLVGVLQSNTGNQPVIDKYHVFLNDYIKSNSREPSIDEQRQLQILAYVEVNFEVF